MGGDVGGGEAAVAGQRRRRKRRSWGGRAGGGVSFELGAGSVLLGAIRGAGGGEELGEEAGIGVGDERLEVAVEKGARGGAITGETGSDRPVRRRGGVHGMAATPVPRPSCLERKKAPTSPIKVHGVNNNKLTIIIIWHGPQI